MGDIPDEHIAKFRLLSGFSAFSLSEEIEVICPEAGHDFILPNSYLFIACYQLTMSSEVC